MLFGKSVRNIAGCNKRTPYQVSGGHVSSMRLSNRAVFKVSQGLFERFLSFLPKVLKGKIIGKIGIGLVLR